MSEFENVNNVRKHSRRGQRWTGLFILLVGVAALLKASLTDLPDWVFSWETFLVTLGFFIGIRQRFRGFGWFMIMLTGGAFLVNDINPDFAIHRYIWPIITIIVGLLFILWSRRHGRSAPGDTTASDDYIDSTSLFGVVNKIILSKDFKGGNIVNTFGGTELNFTQADIQGTAVLTMTTTFGATILIVPADWTVKSDASIVFGGIDDKRSVTAPTVNPVKLLVIKGNVIFGGIDIKSF